CKVDLVTIDSAHGHSSRVLEAINVIKSKLPEVELIAGNVATFDGACELARAGVDGIKVGIGPGSICTTRVVTGAGVPQITAIAAGSSERYFQNSDGDASTAMSVIGDDSNRLAKLVPEGIEARVPYRGSVAMIVYQMVGGLKSGMGYCGCATIPELLQKTRFVRISGAGLRESHVHDVMITREAPNYAVE